MNLDIKVSIEEVIENLIVENVVRSITLFKINVKVHISKYRDERYYLRMN